MLKHLSDRLLRQLFWLLVVAVCVLAIALKAKLWPSEQLFVALIVAGAALFLARRTILKRFREFVFQPIKLGRLPKETRKYFQSLAAELEEVGFTQLGDFLLLPDPGKLQARILISSGRKCLVEISNCDGVHFPSFASVTADGQYFETNALPIASKSPVGEGVPLDIMILPGMDLLEVLQTHVGRVREYEQLTGAEAIEIEPDQFRETINYGHRLAAHDCYQQGLASTAPVPLQSEEATSMAIA